MSNKALVAEFVGWGFPWTDFFTDAQINSAIVGGLPRADIFRRQLGTSTIQFPARNADGTIPDLSSDPLTITLETSRSFGCIEGMWMDLYLGDGSEVYKFGTLVIEDVRLPSQTAIDARIVDLTVRGIEDIDTHGGGSPISSPEHSFFFLYLPRSVTTSAPEEMFKFMRSANMAIGNTDTPLQNFPFAPILDGFQTQLSTEVDIRGGIASSSGFTFSTLYEGRRGNTEPSDDPLPRRCDATQNIEVLLGQNKHTWGSSRQLNPTTGNNGITFLSALHTSGVPTRRFTAPSGGGSVPLITSFATGSTAYWREAFTLYWGNDSSDFVWGTDPEAFDVNNIDVPIGDIAPPGLSGGLDYFVIPDAFGNSPTQPPPRGAEAFSTPPSGVGRRVRLWEVDVDAENPMLDAQRVFEGYVDDWNDSENNTRINFALIDVLSWLRTSRTRSGYRARSEFPPSNSLNARYRYMDRGNNLPVQTAYHRHRPFDIQPEIEFWEDTGDFEQDGLVPVRMRPQWVEFGGYAFPHSLLMYLGGSGRRYAVTQMVTPEADFNQSMPDWNQQLFDFFHLDDYSELVEKVYSFSVRKLGIALDNREDEFDYNNTYDLDPAEDRVELSNSTALLAGDFGSRAGWGNSMDKINLPYGYLQLPNKPYFDWLGYRDLNMALPSVRRLYELAEDISISFDRRKDSRVACIRFATFAYSMLARKIVRDYLEESQPIHVFFSSDTESNLSPYKLSESLTETDAGTSNTRRSGRTQATMVCQVTLAELIMQVLTSTGTFAYKGVTEGSRHAPAVNHGANGKWDTLPAEWGMGIPLPLIDTDQIFNYRFIPYTNPDVRGYRATFSGGPAGVKLDDIFLENVYCRFEDASDMAKWLTDHILVPLGLALVCTPQGKIQIRTLDSFDEALIDPNTGGFRADGVLTQDDLHSDSVDEPPFVSLSQKSTDIIQAFVASYDDGLQRYSVRFPDEPYIDNCHLPTTRYENTNAKLIAKNDSRGKFVVPFVRNADMTNVVNGAGTPYLDIFSLVEKPSTYFHRRVASGGPYHANAEVLATMRSEKVNRWQVQRPEIKFEVAPWWEGNQILTAGTSILVSMPNVPNIDGSRGIVGVVLVLSVQYDILTGVRVCEGRVVAQAPPVPPAFANKWMPEFQRAADQSGVTTNQLRVTFDTSQEYASVLYALGITGLDTSTSVPSRLDGAAVFLVDEYGESVQSTVVAGILETDSTDRTLLLTFADAVDPDAEYVLYDKYGNQPVAQQQALAASGAFLNTIWRFE